MESTSQPSTHAAGVRPGTGGGFFWLGSDNDRAGPPPLVSGGAPPTRICVCEQVPTRSLRLKGHTPTVAWLDLERSRNSKEWLPDQMAGRRTGSLWSGDGAGGRGELLGRLATREAFKRHACYEVRDAHDRVLAVIDYRRRSFWRQQRPRWSIRLAGQPQQVALTARQGRRIWWAIWWPLLPLQMLMLLLTLGQSDGVDYPHSMSLRRGDEVVMRYHALLQVLHVRIEDCDPRVTAALLYLISSY